MTLASKVVVDRHAVFASRAARRLRKRTAEPAPVFCFSLVFAFAFFLQCTHSAALLDEGKSLPVSTTIRGSSAAPSALSGLKNSTAEAPETLIGGEEATVKASEKEKSEKRREASSRARAAETTWEARKAVDADAGADTEQTLDRKPDSGVESRTDRSEQKSNSLTHQTGSQASKSFKAAPTEAVSTFQADLSPASSGPPPSAERKASVLQISPQNHDSLLADAAENTPLVPPPQGFFRSYFRLARTTKCLFSRSRRDKVAFCRWPGLEGFPDPRRPRQAESRPELSSSIAALVDLAPTGTVAREVFPVQAENLPNVTRDAAMLGAATSGAGRFFSLKFPASAYGPSGGECETETPAQSLEALFLSVYGTREACKRPDHSTASSSFSEEKTENGAPQRGPKEPEKMLGAPRAWKALESGECRDAGRTFEDSGTWDLPGPVILFEKLSFFIPVSHKIQSQTPPRYLVALRAKLRGPQQTPGLGRSSARRRRSKVHSGNEEELGAPEEGEDGETGEADADEVYAVEGKCRLFPAGMGGASKELRDTVRLTLKGSRKGKEKRGKRDWAVAALDISRILEEERGQKRGENGLEIRCFLSARRLAPPIGDAENLETASLWASEDEEEPPQIFPSSVLTVVVGGRQCPVGMQEDRRGMGACIPCDRGHGCNYSGEKTSFSGSEDSSESDAFTLTRLAEAVKAQDYQKVPGTLWGDPYPQRGPHCAVGMYMAEYQFADLCTLSCKPLYRRDDKTMPYMQFPGLSLTEFEYEDEYHTYPELTQVATFRCGKGSFTWPSLAACFPALQGFGVMETKKFEAVGQTHGDAYHRVMFDYGYTDCFSGWNNTYPDDESNECKPFTQYKGIIQLVGTWSQPFDYRCAEGSISRKDFFNSPRCYPVPMNRAATGASDPRVTGPLICTQNGFFRPPGMKGKDCLSFVGGAYAASTGTHMFLRDLPGQPFHRGASRNAPARLCETYEIECSPHGDFPSLDLFVNLFPTAPSSAAAGVFQPHGIDGDVAGLPRCPYGANCPAEQLQGAHPRLPRPYSLTATRPIRSRRGLTGRQELVLGAGVDLATPETLTDVWIYMPGANAPEYCCHGCQCKTTGTNVRLSKSPAGTFRGRRMASGDMKTFHECSPGHACPAAAIFETPCRAGSYQLASGGAACSLVAPGSAGTGLGALRPVACPPGHFCVQEAKTPFENPCPAGTMNEQVGGATETACLPCPAGYICGKGTGGRSRPGFCPVGHYCERGAKRPAACPAGTYAPYAFPSPNMTNARNCRPCPEHLDCPQGSSLHTLQASGACPPGAYCPGGNAAKALKCPIGMYGVEPGGQEPADCLYCPAGHFCKVTPPTDPTFPTTAEPCPPDSFSINTGIAGNSSRIFASEWTREAGVQTVFTTNGGGLCRTETADFSLFTNVRKADGRGLPSDALASIIEGDNLFWIVTAEGQGVVSVDNLFSFNPITLPRETTLLGYGNHRLWAGSSSSAGLWVSKDRGWSFSQVAPAISSATVFASDPVSGYLCVGDSSTVFCSGDNFEAISATSALAGVRALLVLPGGDMVVAATAAHVFQSRDGGRRFTRVTSLRGAAVRLLSRGANEVFVASTQGVSKSTDRGASFAGWARNLPPESLPISDFHVQADAFLLRHSSGFLRSSTGDNWQPVALPTDSPCGQFPVTHSVVADFRLPAAVPETSGQCIRGSLSKAKAALVSKPGEMILNGVVVPCREGFFCPETCDETNQVVLPCPAGTWCESGVDRQPSLGSHPCPRGHYCPEATDAPVKCPAGTYNHELHQATADACRPAPAGYSIDTQGAAEPLQLCPAGNFCPEGTSDGGTVCPPGTSRRLPGGAAESDCFPCPAGYFCPNDSSTGTSLDPKPCPEGHYCPLGSAAAAQCPAGTLSSSRSVSSAEECDLCPRGSYCTEPGALAVTGACDAGFLCIAGATDPRPTDGVTGSPCPAGGYCVAGTVIVKPCPPGTYNPDEGAENEDACQPCPAGSFCLGSGSSTPDGKCRPGHYCPEQSSRATQRKASIGHFAAAGASEETACEVGYYAPEEGMDKCIACPAGQVCPREGMAAPEECPQGWYCPEAVAAALKCVAGTYGDRPGLREWNECKLCPPGHFCEGEGLLDKSGLCDAGYYCVQSATSARPEIVSTGRSLAGEVSGPCPAGHFCPQGSITPTPCPKGMFSSTLKAVSEATCQQCTEGFYCDRPGLAAPTGPCPEGYFCPRGSVVDRDPTHLCPRGHYCPQQAVEALPCSAGTYAEVDGSAACTPCPGGFLCAASAQQFLQACSAGHYCPTGTQAEIECPIGTVGVGSKGPHVSACLACPPGSYCDRMGSAVPTDSCPPGKFCGGGVASANAATACPEGFYCPEGSAVPFACKAGQYCQGTSLVEPSGPCQPNTHCPAGTSEPEGFACPRGSYCPGDTDPLPCPPGTYSDVEGIASVDQCKRCPSGSYCSSPGLDAPSGLCTGGYFCEEGTVDPRPVGGLCPKAHKCPPGASAAEACLVNEWQPLKGQTDCQPCPAGFICDDTEATPCDAGYYCDGVDGTKKACPVGTYQPLPGQTSEASCLPCKSGYVCGSPGLASPVDKCPAGSYCVGASQHPCPEGFYCPEGTEAPYPCSPGHYCQGDGLERPTGLCAQGHYCAKGATVRNPTGSLDIEFCFTSLTSGDCPAGYYCPEGIAFPVRCPPGTFSAGRNKGALSDCQPCTAGFYCGGFALTAVSGPCLAGFYCPAGERTPYGHPCPKGSFCPAGAPAAEDCPEGLYQPAEGKSKCLTCIDGFMCPEGSAEVTPCTAGHYCAAGVAFRCPAGTYSPSTGIWKASQCRPCPPGKVCSAEGAQDTTAATACPEGHYCRLGASATPDNDPSTCGRDPTSCLPGARCPSGYYCPPDSAGAIPCPQGTTGSPEGSSSPTQCTPCPPGSYCSGAGASGECDPGFFCEARSTVARPTSGICPMGHYCGRGSATGTACPSGTYADVEGLAECLKCPPGFVCAGQGLTTGTDVPCPAGHFCPEGTVTARECPVGTFSRSTHAPDESWCSPCPPGKFCDSPGREAPAGDCLAGYFCLAGATQNNPPTQDPPGPNGECPRGFYCPPGSSAPKACPPGTFSATPRATQVQDCEVCLERHFCGVYGLEAPEGLCDEGFFCGVGQVSARPLGAGLSGLCPAGYACTGGLKAPCPDHSYMDEQGASVCKSCPAGHFCEAQALAPQRCPATFFCETGKGKKACPDGTYSDATGLSASSECLECPTTKFCANGRIQDACSAGFICGLGVGPTGTPSGSPADERPPRYAVQLGEPCPRGAYCPAGIDAPLRCPPGTTTASTGATSVTDCVGCSPGFYCAAVNTAATGCPRGHYCPAEAREPRPCPEGTYNPSAYAEAVTSCLACDPGFLCPEGSDQQRTTCPLGFYCEGGSAPQVPCPEGTYGKASGTSKQDDACGLCPAGHYCPGADHPYEPCPEGKFCTADSPKPVACPPGFYCPGATSVPSTCPLGFYCPLGTSLPLECPNGSLCPEAAAQPQACPAGTRSRGVQACASIPTVEGCCEACPVGTFSSREGSVECAPCAAGHICAGGASTARPTDGVHGYICPPGAYCPAGARSPVPCPAGRFNAEAGAGDEATGCLPCPAGTFSDEPGATSCSTCGGTSTSLEGQQSCACLGAGRTFQKQEGTCVCRNFYEFYSSTLLARGDENEDSSLDCQPIAQARCESAATVRNLRFSGGTGSRRLRAADGACVSENVCEEQCGPGVGGIFLANVGKCQCHSVQDAAQKACDRRCRAEVAELLVDGDAFACTMPGSPTAERTPVQSLIDSSRLKGSVACNRDTDASSGAPACRVSFYLLDETGVFGTVGVPAGFQTLLTTAEHPPATDASSSRVPAHADASQREEKPVEQATSQSCVVPSSMLSPQLDQQRTTCAKAEEEALSALEEELYGREKNNKMALIRNPTQCLQKGDTIIWMIAGAFPVYLRNSLLNTAAEFDASQYLKVQGDLAYESYDEKKPVTYFAFSFTVPGQFVFASNVRQSHQAIFRVLDDGVACDNDARFPHPTEFASLAAAGIQMRDDVLLEPALADVELLFWGTLCILLTFVVLVSWLRKLQFNKKQRESVASERLEKRSGRLSVVARKQAVAQTFGVHAVAHRTRAEIENLLSHVIESGRVVDSRARVTRLSPEELEAFLLAFQDAADALDDSKEPSKPPFDLRMFETAYNRLARARLVLGEYFRDRKLGVTQLGIEQVKILDNLQNFVAPIIRKVDWKLDESSQLQKTISAMTKACEKLVDELRAPQAFFASDALDDSAASSSRVQQYMLSTPFSLERGGKKAVFLALAEEVTGVVCMTRGESPTLPVLAQYLEALRGSLEDEDESEAGASVSLSTFVQSTTDSLESALEEVLKHRERQASLDVQLTERPFSDAIARARIADRCEQDLFSLLLDCAEALLTDSVQTMADEKGRRRDSARERRRSSKAAGDEGDERADAGERGQETGDDGRKGEKKTEGILRVGGGQARQRENPVTEIQEAIQTLCDRQLEEMSRTLATQQQAYRAALDKRESAATHQIEGRQMIEKVLLSQFHQFFKATEARRLSQFYQHLESSRIAKLREDLKEEMYEMERTRRREAWAQAEYEEKRKKALQHFEAQIKATAEAFKGEKDGVVLATLDTLESLQERRNAALEVVHSMETVLLKAKATQAKDLADELFEQQAERMKKDLGGRRARFLLVAQNIVRLHDRIASGDVIPTAQLEDMVEDAAAILEDLRRSQANERREWLKGQREVRDAISERHKGTLQSKTADVKDATRQYVAQEIGLYSELFRREEDALLPHGKRAVIDTVEAVFAKQLKQQRKAYHLVLEESEAELRDSPGKGTETYPAPGFPHTQETGGEFMKKKSRFEEANEQRLALKEDEKAKQIQDLETRLSEVREKRSEALRGVAELEVEVTERYLIKVGEGAGRLMEDEAFEASSMIAAEAKRLSQLQRSILEFAKQQLVATRNAGKTRGKKSHFSALGGLPRETKRLLQVAEEDRMETRAEYENNVRQRSRAETRGVLAGSLAARGAAVEADENVNRLLLKLREKRGDVHASLFFLDDLVGTICDAKFSTREMVQIDAQYDRATRELEEEFERELRALQEEFDSDSQRLEAELAEVRLRLRRTEEMEKSRLEVDRRLREATASSEEEIAAVRRDFAQRIDRVQKEFDSEREAQEQALQAKLAQRRELFNKRRQKLAGKAQAEEARTQEDLQRKKSVAHSQRKKATFELLLDEARSHPTDTTIRQLHKFMSSELSEVVNATVLEQLAEKSARLTAVSTEMQKKQADERRAAEHELDGKISAAEKKLASASEENAAQMMEDVANLKQMKEAKLRELEATFSLKLESALQVERLAIEPVQAERVFQIQQESLKNMVKVLGEFVVLNDPTAIGLTDQVKQAQARIEMERSRMKEIAGMKVLDLDKILKEKEAELKKQMEASIAALREKLKAQQEREEQLQREKHEAEMKKRKEEQRARRLKQLRRMINSAQPDDPEAADDIFKKYQDDAERLEAALAKERARQHMLLQSQLFQRANRKEHRLRQEGEGELSEEWSRLKKTRELAAVPQETGNGTKDADELDEEEMWKYFFTVRVAEEVGKKAKTVQELLRAALKQLTSGPPKDDVGGALAAEMAEFATPDSIENLVDKLSRLTEALVVSEDDEDEE